MNAHRFTDADKRRALRELETAHFEHGLADSAERIRDAGKRARAASARMREILGLEPVRDADSPGGNKP
jgi:hypothetical protein